MNWGSAISNVMNRPSHQDSKVVHQRYKWMISEVPKS